MTKAETRKLTLRLSKNSIAGRRKATEFRETWALMLMGYIRCLRDLQEMLKKAKRNQEAAEAFGGMCQLKERTIIKQLRKV